MSRKKEVHLSSLALLVVAFLSVQPARMAAAASGDSKEIAALLSVARQQAAQLHREASDLESYQWEKLLNRQCHVLQITALKDQGNQLLGTVRKLNQARGTGSPQQQKAIDRINPATREVAASIQSTIEHLNDDRGELETKMCAQYQEFVKKISGAATKLDKLFGEI